MPTIFLSYRRSDSLEETTRIKKFISGYFGENVIFRDQESIPAGSDFREIINDALKDCVAMIAVIGETWLSAIDETGERRLDDAKDWVRIELESALAKYIPVVPVLVQNATIPKPEELPSKMEKLAFRNAVKLDTNFDTGMEKLCDDLSIQLWGR